MSAAEPDIRKKKLTRRGFLKWTTALAVVGAAAVGIGAGYGSDLLLRPNTEKTTTETTTKTGTVTLPGQTSTETTTSTKTVTAPVQTLSYVPPLSPEVQTLVNKFIQDRQSLHSGEEMFYAALGEWPPDGEFATAGMIKVRTKNGVITTTEPDDSINPGVAIEDKAISWDAVMQQLVQGRTLARLYAYPEYLYHPQRVLYPMKRVGGTRGYPNGTFVRITWDEALTTVATKMTETKAKYGNYSINSNPLASWFGCDAEGWGCDSNEAKAFAYRFVYGTGYGMGCGMSDFSESPNMFSAKLIILVGVNNTTQD